MAGDSIYGGNLMEVLLAVFASGQELTVEPWMKGSILFLGGIALGFFGGVVYSLALRRFIKRQEAKGRADFENRQEGC